MAKVQFSDVVPPDRRSIRNIPIPNSGKRGVSISAKPEPKPEKIYSPKDSQPIKIFRSEREAAGEKPEIFISTGERSKKKPFVFGAIALVLVGGFLFAMMTVFASATVLITPKSQETQVSINVLATKESRADAIRYEVIKLSKTQTATVPAAGEEIAEAKASGKIVIYNNFSTEPQRLIVRTRFETPQGLIFRIAESVVVPGKTTKSGVSSPGSIEVEVFADEAGEKYNVDKTDFTIPGFKNDAERYKKFYARSSTDMTGGFVGKRKTVLQADKEKALQDIDAEAQAFLEKDLSSKVPSGLTLLSGSVVYESRELPQEENSSSVVLGKDVTAYAILLNKEDLSREIVEKYAKILPGWETLDASVEDFSFLKVVNKPDKVGGDQEMNLQISGKAKFFADVDTEVISQKLVGTKRGQVANLIDEFASISSIKVTIRPIWKRSFPVNPLKINIKTNIEGY